MAAHTKKARTAATVTEPEEKTYMNFNRSDRNRIRRRILGQPPVPRRWPLRLYATLMSAAAVWLLVSPWLLCLDVRS